MHGIDRWSIKCLKHRLVSKLHLFQRRYLNLWVFLFAPRCTPRYPAKCFAFTGLASFRGGQPPLLCRTLGSRCPRAPPGSWESWNFFLCDGFSVESSWCTVSSARAHQRSFQLQDTKSTFFMPWSMNEVWSNCCYGQELWGYLRHKGCPRISF